MEGRGGGEAQGVPDPPPQEKKVKLLFLSFRRLL
jgi:hypothetical protein